MKNSIKVLAVAILLVVSMFNSQTVEAQQKKEFTVAWSIYAGWNPWSYAQTSGILKKHADKQGITINLVKMDYIPSIEAYTTPSVDACAMTNMDCLTIPVAGGIRSTAVITGDFSNGNESLIRI